MIPAPRYTDNASVKAAGPDSHPVNTQAHSAIFHDIGAFFSPVAPSLADCVGQPQGWPALSPVVRTLPDPPPHFALVATVPSLQLRNPS